MNSCSVKNAISIDVEEYFQVSAFESRIPINEWALWPSRVEFSTCQLLDVLNQLGVKATFFTLGWVAENHGRLVRRIVSEGHELACHGYNHARITSQTIHQFRADLLKSKAILEDTAQQPVFGYRAASFSINRHNLWAFNEIENAGFTYSSSVYPVKHDLYGIPDAPRFPFRPAEASVLVEIPVSTVRIRLSNFPAGGGGFFRLFPYALSKMLIRRINLVDGKAANVYFHPWEFDPNQPRVPGISAKSQFRHYLNQGTALSRLRRLLADFHWGPFRDVYASVINATDPSAVPRGLDEYL